MTDQADPGGRIELKHQAVRGVFTSLGSQAARMSIQFASLAVLSRLLGPEEFGLVAIVMAVVGVGELLRDLGLSSASIQRRELSRGLASNLFWVNCLTGTLALVGVAAAGPFIASAFDEPRLVWVALGLAPMFLFSGLTAQHRVTLVRDLRFGALGAIELAGQGAGVLAAIMLAFAGRGVEALISQALVSGVVTMILMWVAAGWIPSLPKRGMETRSVLGFAGAMLGSSLLTYVSLNIDTLVVAHQFGSAQVGLYNRGAQLVRTPLRQLLRPFGAVLYPLMSRAQDDDRTLLMLARRSQLFSSTPVAMCAAVVIAAPQQLITVVLGDKWTSMASVSAVLAGAFTIATLASVGSTVLASRGLGYRLTQLAVATSTFDVIGVLVGARGGLVGVAWGILVACSLGWLASLAWVRRCSRLPVWPLLAQGAMLIIVGGVAAASGRLATSQIEVGALIEVAIAAAVVGVVFVSLLLVGSVRSDLTATWSVIRARKSSTSR